MMVGVSWGLRGCKLGGKCLYRGSAGCGPGSGGGIGFRVRGGGRGGAGACAWPSPPCPCLPACLERSREWKEEGQGGEGGGRAGRGGRGGGRGDRERKLLLDAHYLYLTHTGKERSLLTHGHTKPPPPLSFSFLFVSQCVSSFTAPLQESPCPSGRAARHRGGSRPCSSVRERRSRSEASRRQRRLRSSARRGTWRGRGLCTCVP